MGIFFCRRDVIADTRPAYAARNSVVPGAADDHFVERPDAPLRDDAVRFETGNYNYSGTYAMSAALDLILGVGIREIERHVLALGRRLTEQLAARGIARIGPDRADRRSSICAFDFPGDGWVDYLARKHVVVSGRRGAIRISLGLYNSFDEIDELVAIVDGRSDR
jgi:selenocysteine lyase/cysteine desulfurase